MKLTTREKGSSLDGQLLKKLHEKIVNDFLDIIILSKLQKAPASAYSLHGYIQCRFSVAISTGTIYSLTESLEQKKLIIGEWADTRRLLSLTPKGEELITTISGLQKGIIQFIGLVFDSEQSLESVETC